MLSVEISPAYIKKKLKRSTRRGLCPYKDIGFPIFFLSFFLFSFFSLFFECIKPEDNEIIKNLNERNKC